MESITEIVERADYLPPEMLYDANYFADPEGAQLQGLIIGVFIVGVIIFKVLRKFKAPTEKPNTTIIQDILKIFNNFKLAFSILKSTFLAKMARPIDFLISLKKKSPRKDDK